MGSVDSVWLILFVMGFLNSLARVLKTRKVGTSIYYSVSNPKIIQACDLMRQVLLEQMKENEKLTMLVSQARRR